MTIVKTKSWSDESSSRPEKPPSWLQRTWDDWSSSSIGNELSGAALLHYLPDRPSRMFPLIVFQEGFSLYPPDFRFIVDGVKGKTLQNDYFWLGDGKYLVTTVNEHYFNARRMNSTAHEGGGAIVACLPSFILITLYEGSLGAAAKAMAVTGLLMDCLNQRY